MSISIYLAPLHGVTNRIFRKAYFNHFSGFDGVVAPFVLSVNTDQLKRNHFKDILPQDETGIPVIPQILGNDIATFVKTSNYLFDHGYPEINWNLGCPYPMVANKKRGSGLLPHPEVIDALLDGFFKNAKTSISVKLRLGRYEPTEILRLMPVLNRYPLKKVIVHPRIGIQMYKGTVDLGGFAAALDLCRHPVMYNGDIQNVLAFEQLRNRFPAIHEWMIGRGAIATPFLASQIKDRSNEIENSSIQKIRAFHDELYDSYREALSGPAHLLDKMKEIWTYLQRSFPDSGNGLERIIRSKSSEAYEAAVSEVFASGFRKG